MEESPAAPSTVFVVDDDRGLLRLMEKALQREGISTARAGSGKEATSWLAKNRADLMLLDLKLQDIEGKELVSHLASTDRALPFIVITGQGDERVAVEMMKRGAVDYLVKDANFLQFLPEVVRRALGQLEREKKIATMETERKRLEKEIIGISELEQRRLGQDLHDGLCQQLAGIELMSQVLEQRLSTKSKDDAVRAGEIARHVRAAIAQTRGLARGLSPVELDENGLMFALQELSANVEKMFNVECKFRCDAAVLISDNATATHLFRIAQEAASNAVKHGKAKRVEIGLTALPEKITLTITDDGAGFPAQPGKGMGLRIMNYRAGIIGGALTIQDNASGGTTVACSIQRPAVTRAM